MGQVTALAERDRAIFQAWVDGARQVDLADQYGVAQSTISAAIGRVLSAMPEPDRAQEVRRTLDLVDDLVSTFVGKARAGDPAASREVRGLLALRGRYLGIDRREVQVEHGGTVQLQVQRPVEPWEVTVERVLAKAITSRNGDQDIVEAELVTGGEVVNHG